MAQNWVEIGEAVLAFVNAPTWSESKRIVEERRDMLLTDAADEILADLLTQYRDNEDTTSSLEGGRDLLARCRGEGIDAAFASYLQPPAATPENQLEALIEELKSPSAPGQMPQRITVCQEASTLIDRNDRPELWAELQVELGDSLRQNPQGDRAQNIEDAISRYELALEVRTREDFPVGWAETQNSLALAYDDRVRGDKAENIEEVISRYKLALEVYTRKDFPMYWATLQYNLAVAYRERIGGDKAENIEEAISRYELALEVYTLEDSPADWAAIQHSLAFAYRQRIRGERASNIEEAISHYKQALGVRTREALPVDWARTQYNLARAYSDWIRGDKAENQEEAISRYELALEVYTRKDFPEDWAWMQRNLAVAYRQRIRGERAENIEKALSLYDELALEVYTREDFPEYWASVQHLLADTYRQRIRGEKAENQEEAISRYQQALGVRTREDFPEDWAALQNNLAVAYRSRIRGEKAENQEEVISRYKLALEVRTREDLPVKWANTQYDLANAYRERIRGKNSDNIEEAIFHCEQALEVYTREDMPVKWARMQNNLAVAYRERIRGEKAENLEEAISRYERTLEVYTREDFPVDWARVQSNLAVAYGERIRGEKAENIEEAISRNELALEVYTREDFPKEWARIQSNMAATPENQLRAQMRKLRSGWRCLKALIMVLLTPRSARTRRMRWWIVVCQEALTAADRSDNPEWWAWLQHELGDSLQKMGESLQKDAQGDGAQSIEEAISHYEQALVVYTREDFPEKWAKTQGNIGLAYSDRIRGDTAQNQEEAISRYEKTLEVYTREDFPLGWATAQANLATAYRNRIWGDTAENLEEAISRGKQALEVRRRFGEDLPLDWAMIQDFMEDWAMIQGNLAGAYSDRIRGDRAENLEEAISRHKLALEVHTRENFPVEWADRQDNLANEYLDRIRGDRAENVEEAISRHKLALEVRTRRDFPLDWAATQNNLANAYSERVQGDRAENLEEAISRYELALEVQTREDFPALWARTQGNLGLAYKNRIRGDKADNVEEAISRHKLALEVRTREYIPVLWTLTQNDLANAYSERVRGDRAENLEEAISRYELALEVHTPTALPQDCRDTAYSLGCLLYGEGRFGEARAALTTAHKAVETIRGELQREGAKQKLAEENADLYARLVHCCLLDGDEEAAFEYAVAGKGRAFVDMLATARFNLSADGADDPRLAEELRRYRDLSQQIDNLLARLFGDSEASPDEDGDEQRSVRSQMQASLRSLQEQKAAHWEEMSYRYPALTATQQAPTLSAEEAGALARELGATLVEFYHHADGWCAFVVTSGGVRYVPLHSIDDDLMEDMSWWIEGVESGRRINELSYESLRGLHEALIAPLQDYLLSGGAVVLAPFGGLHLLPLGAALGGATNRYAAEEYRLASAPSLAALRVARDQARKTASFADGRRAERLLSVAYPGTPGSPYYLPNVLPEAKAVARHFARVTPLHEDGATPDAVRDHARGQEVVHLGCHGTFEQENPEQSGLALSGGYLTVQRIITELHLDGTQLATVGACLSGRVKVRRGEEHVGLLQAMMTAGARAVVASLWKVEDAATRALFEAFYSNIANGDSLAEALARAGRSVRTNPRWEHPYYWAAFQVSGLAHASHEPAGSPEDAAPYIEEAYDESEVGSKRGGSIMSTEEVVRGSLGLLWQMTRHSKKVVARLDPGERGKVMEELPVLAGRAERVHTEAELLDLVEAIHRLVRETPALRALLLPDDIDVEAAWEQRTIKPSQETTSPESRHAQEHAAQIHNRMINCYRKLQQSYENLLEPETDDDL